MLLKADGAADMTRGIDRVGYTSRVLSILTALALAIFGIVGLAQTLEARQRVVCDFHGNRQTISMLERDTGQVVEKTLKHEGEAVGIDHSG